MLHRISRGFVLRSQGKRFDAIDQMGLMVRRSTVSVGASPFPFTSIALGLFCLMAVIAVVLFHPHAAQSVASAHTDSLRMLLTVGIAGITAAPKSGTDPKKPAKIREMEASLKSLAKELETGQSEMAAGVISQERGEELEEKAKEMEELQEHLDRYNKIAGVVRSAREVKDVTLPSDNESISRKRLFTTPGHIFIGSKEFKAFQSVQSGWSSKVEVPGRLGKNVLLVGKEAADFEAKAFDAANLAVLGTDSIIPYDRDPELVRYQEPEWLTIRDMLNVVPTTSDTVKFVKYTTTHRAAAPQSSRGGLKAFIKLSTELVSTPIETIAVLAKVTEQDIEDAPRLVGLINGEMTLDVKVEEERQLTWGDGSGGSIKGLFHQDTPIPEFNRADAGDSLIDTIRKMRTDLRKAHVVPNFVAIDPTDWESVELAKGTTNYYIWGLVSDMRGPRIWSLQVVESDAMTNLETGERRVLMGDGKRGATIYDRAGIQLAVGFMDDDFGRNLRTMRCEERLGLGVKRSFAFEYLVTDEALS
jgi:HK97 family phage major capsid protein